MIQLVKARTKVLLAACFSSLAVSQTSCTQVEHEKPSVAASQEGVSKFNVNYVDAKGAAALLKSNSDIVVLDIRTPKEIQNGFIEGAIFTDFFDESFGQKLSQLDRNKPYIVHCGSGGRSTKALTTLEELGFTKITHMDGGIQGWNKADLPLTKR